MASKPVEHLHRKVVNASAGSVGALDELDELANIIIGCARTKECALYVTKASLGKTGIFGRITSTGEM